MLEKKDYKVNLKLIQSNYAWFIAILTLCGILITNIFRFFEYVKAGAYFSHYGLDINLYRYGDINFIYGLCLSILFLLSAYALLYCFQQLCTDLKNKNFKAKSILTNIVWILLANLYIILIIDTKLTVSNIITNFFILVVAEFGLSMIINKKTFVKNIKVTNKEGIINSLKNLPFLIIILFIFLSFNTFSDITKRQVYRVIDNNKVIVYSNNDYFLTLDCKFQDDTLIIYKGTQEKILTTNVYSILKKYDKVKID